MRQGDTCPLEISLLPEEAHDGKHCRTRIANVNDVGGFTDMLIGYARVSSTGDRQNTNLQRDALIAAGVDPRNIYEDHASGAREDRPGLKAAMAFLSSGDVLVVWKLDRLGRSLTHLISIVNTLAARGVMFRSLTEGMDTTTAIGQMLYKVFGAFAEYEREITRERIMAGLDAARRRGRVGGRPLAIRPDTLTAIQGSLATGMTQTQACLIYGVKRTTLIDTLARQEIAR
jgi:DNA invertase Pin-like site-specific DNA recombinase